VSAARPPLLQVGYVSRAHGLKGEVAVRTFDPASEVLFEVDRVSLRRKDGTEAEFTVKDVRSTSKDLLVSLAEASSRPACEALVGSTVFVFRCDLEPPAEGEYFQGDLLGLLAVDEAGQEVGRVEEIWSHGEVPTLVIRGGGQEHLLPFVDQFIPQVDVDAGRLTVRIPEIAE
jgi:16S rRNA processing protein RimM